MDVEQYMSDNNANKYTLDGIPEEIVVHILSFLSPKQLCDVLTISHKWKEIGEDSSLWRRLCEIRFLTDSDETIEDKDQSNNNNNNSKDWKRIFASRSQLWKRITANYLTHTDESLTDIFSVVNEDETKCPLRAMYTGWDHFGNSSSTVGVVQAVKQAELFPFGSFPFVYYFEITVINSGNSGFIGCGLAPSGYKQAEPGWKSRSYGYHGDDGRIYSNSGWGTHWNDTWGTGDTIGCLVNLVTKEIQYTKNGFLLGTAFRNVVVDFFHATVGLHSAREEVEFNFGAKSFQFDLVHYIQMELQKYQETNLYKEYAAKVCVQPASETPITPEEDEPLSLLMKRLQEYDPERDDNDDEFANELRHLVRALGAGRETINTEDMPVSELRMLVRILMMFQVANRQEQDQEPQEEEHDIVDMDSEPEQPNQ